MMFKKPLSSVFCIGRIYSEYQNLSLGAFLIVFPFFVQWCEDVTHPFHLTCHLYGFSHVFDLMFSFLFCSNDECLCY